MYNKMLSTMNSPDIKYGFRETTLNTPPKSLEDIDNRFNADVNALAGDFNKMFGGFPNLQIENELEVVKGFKDYFDSFIKLANDNKITFEGSEEGGTKEEWISLISSFSKLMETRIKELNETSPEGTAPLIGGDPYPCSIAGVGIWCIVLTAIAYGTNEVYGAPFGTTIWNLISGWLAVLSWNFQQIAGDLDRNTIGGIKIAVYRLLLWMESTFSPMSFVSDSTKLATTGLPAVIGANFTVKLFEGKVVDSWLAQVIFWFVWLFRVICGYLGERYITREAESTSNVVKQIEGQTINFPLRGGSLICNMPKLIGMYYGGLPADTGVAGDTVLNEEEKKLAKRLIQDLQVQTKRLLDQTHEWPLYNAKLNKMIKTNQDNLKDLVVPVDGGRRRRSKRRMQKSKRGTKHGGRSRMRKMRTKKRRMSRRKYRR